MHRIFIVICDVYSNTYCTCLHISSLGLVHCLSLLSIMATLHYFIHWRFRKLYVREKRILCVHTVAGIQ